MYMHTLGMVHSRSLSFSRRQRRRKNDENAHIRKGIFHFLVPVSASFVTETASEKDLSSFLADSLSHAQRTHKHSTHMHAAAHTAAAFFL